MITGAAGHLGSRVVNLLLDAGVKDRVIAGSRDPSKLAAQAARGAETRTVDFENAATLETAFRGVDRLLIVSTDAFDRPGRRLAQHRAAVDAAVKAGVKHIVYTSVVKARPDSPVIVVPEHYHTEQIIAGAAPGYTILRNNLYSEVLLGYLAPALKSGQWYAAAGNGGVAWLPREDCARAAAAALAADFDGKRTLEVTGPEILTHADVAKIVTEVTGRPLTYVPITVAEEIAGMVKAGLPEPVAQLYASFSAGIAQGELAVQTSAVADLTGRAATTVRDFLTASRAALTA